MALIPLLGIRIRPPGVSGVLPRWHLCLAPTGVSRTRRFSIDCGSYVNPVHDQIRDSFVTALEVLTRSARSDSPRKTRPERNSGEVGRRRRRTAAAA
ncbi:threonine--tRNA ligase, mitochondrial-like [Dorcoceras hygrometricum]|uniref:Threonine--tRNA ligase, mitochondrial-like n=1 Tax=Dorcoceras hygrometricum TaxID=472368 RepID=A0A2Z6ZSC9_9LAMI|nr:threonine--tRNA ligase, mitochondrial-like [Dorcoceras hygrometricum]